MQVSESVVKFLEKEDIRFSQLDDKTIYRVGFEGKSGTFVMYIDIDEERGHIECVTICPLRAAEDTTAEVLKLFAHLNWRLATGHFDIDCNEGDIRFRVGLFAGSSELDHEMIRHLVLVGISSMDMFIPIIASVIYGKVGAEDALSMHTKRASKNADTKASDGQVSGFGGRLGGIMDGSNN